MDDWKINWNDVGTMHWDGKCHNPMRWLKYGQTSKRSANRQAPSSRSDVTIIKTRSPWATMLTWVNSYKSLIQHFRLSVPMATNQNEEFVQFLYSWWRTTQQTFINTINNSPKFQLYPPCSFWGFIFSILFANLAFHIKLRDLNKRYMFCRGPLNKYF